MKIAAMLCLFSTCQFGFAGEGKDNKPSTGHVYFSIHPHFQSSTPECEKFDELAYWISYFNNPAMVAAIFAFAGQIQKTKTL